MTRRPPTRSKPFRLMLLGLGALAMLLAPIVAIPAPGPAGTFLFAFGLALVLRNSPRARRRYVRHIRRYPRLQRVINFGLRRKDKRRPDADASVRPERLGVDRAQSVVVIEQEPPAARA